jgi:iron complex outermembrane receptor protein
MEFVLPQVLEGGQPNLRPEVAYGFNYGAVWTPKFIRGLTLSVDFYHIDLRDRTNFFDAGFVVEHEDQFPGRVVREPPDPVTGLPGRIILVRRLIDNISRTITEGFDYEAIYTVDTAVFGKGNFGTFTFTLNGNYLSRYVAAINVGDREREFAGQETFFGGYFPHNRFYASAFYDLGGLDTGVTVHYIGQGSDGIPVQPPPHFAPRKIREWTTVDALVSYTFKMSAPGTASPVAGYAKDGGKNVEMKDGKDKSLMPVSTAEYNQCGWRAWLNGSTVTLGMNNIFDQDPPFVAGAFENGYDESTFDIKGRFWYVALKKRF